MYHFCTINCMGIKIIFVDIDWTLFDHSNRDHVFDYASIEKLKEVQARGVKIFICTARAYHTVKQIGILELLKPDGLILNNGGFILYNDEIIYESFIDQKKFEDFVEYVSTQGLVMEGVERFHPFLTGPITDLVKDVYYDFYEDTPPIESYRNRKVISCMLFSRVENDEEIAKHLPEGFHMSRFHEKGCDIYEEERIKGFATRFVIDYLHLDKDSAMAIGDDYGDISMFDEVTHSVAMANGKPEVKNAAKYVTDEVWNHGVKNILEKFWK